VSIADTPTMIMLDYRECGRQGEPRVVYVDQEDDYSMTLPDFATFVQGPGHQDAGFGRSFEPFCCATGLLLAPLTDYDGRR
jgi:hypothetical protein